MAGSGGASAEDLESSMQQAQEEADLLKAIVQPMEKELVQLRLKVKVGSVLCS